MSAISSARPNRSRVSTTIRSMVISSASMSRSMFWKPGRLAILRPLMPSSRYEATYCHG